MVANKRQKLAIARCEVFRLKQLGLNPEAKAHFSVREVAAVSSRPVGMFHGSKHLSLFQNKTHLGFCTNGPGP